MSSFLSRPDQVILKEREERKQKRLLEERGLPHEEFELLTNAADEEQCLTEATGESTHAKYLKRSFLEVITAVSTGNLCFVLQTNSRVL